MRTITLNNIAVILAFLPSFKNLNSALYQTTTDDNFRFELIQYSDEFSNFIKTLYHENFIIAFDWVTWQNEATFVNDPQLLNLADIDTLQKLLTTHVRKERFCNGHLAAVSKNGQLLAILKRLKCIQREYEELLKMQKVSVVVGDITKQQVDAIVNAANNSLLGGGGVDGAIHRAAGSKLLAECRQLNGCTTGDAKITKGYNLPAKWVIHTVGPVWRGGNYREDELLAQCYRSCLTLATQYEIKTIAFPAISTGVYAFPVERAANIAVREIQQFLVNNHTLEQVLLVCFSQSSGDRYLDALTRSE